jgi:hypothetical protein
MFGTYRIIPYICTQITKKYMEKENIIDEIKEEIKIVKIMNYFQMVFCIPFIVVSFFFIIPILLTALMVHCCRSLSIAFDDYEEFKDKLLVYSMKGSVEEGLELRDKIHGLTVLLLFISVGTAGYAIKHNIWLCYDIIAPVMYVCSVLLIEDLYKKIKALDISIDFLIDELKRKGIIS